MYDKKGIVMKKCCKEEVLERKEKVWGGGWGIYNGEVSVIKCIARKKASESLMP